ncbi:hypothetical protein DFP72DRAFT_1042290 [Ephemerocybe angulata]|uniref:Uncharacterized protein n=1 Tax=Ephemerocybe angulata TaxID=980116 RepID=A0A8H6IAC2_9AGAR|nr:hypothetical protein DFP72DRAFT_1042290 [Tulosesus angulatus]
MPGLRPKVFSTLFALEQPQSWQHYINYYSSRLRAAVEAFLIRRYPEATKKLRKRYMGLLWDEYMFTHACVGFATSKYPESVEAPEFYKNLSIMQSKAGARLEDMDLNAISSLLQSSADHDPIIPAYEGDWWNDKEKVDTTRFALKINILSQAWNIDKDRFPFQPNYMDVTEDDLAEMAAHLEETDMPDEIRQTLQFYKELDERMVEEIKRSLELMVKCALVIERTEAQSASMTNPNLESPLIETFQDLDGIMDALHTDSDSDSD